MKGIISFVMLVAIMLLSSVSFAEMQHCRPSCQGIDQSKCVCATVNGKKCCRARDGAMKRQYKAKQSKAGGCHATCRDYARGACACVRLSDGVCCAPKARQDDFQKQHMKKKMRRHHHDNMKQHDRREKRDNQRGGGY